MQTAVVDLQEPMIWVRMNSGPLLVNAPREARQVEILHTFQDDFASPYSTQ